MKEKNDMNKLTDEIEEFISSHCQEEKARFDEGLISTIYEIKGVRMDELSEFAKKLALSNPRIEDFPLRCHEEILIAGITLAFSKQSADKKVKQIQKLLPYIDNWATCDLICLRLKKMESQKQFFVNLLKTKKPFYIRFGIVWLMKYALKKDLRGTVNLINDNVRSTNYYVEMALAWCYSEALILDYDYMIEFTQTLPRYVVRNRTLQKACDSTRVSPERKKEIRKLRSKLLGMEI